jgi:hypothetical protein
VRWPWPEGLTRHVAGTYGYLLKIDLDRPTTSVVKSLAITTWFQVAPAALPSLREGENRREFRASDHYGLPSCAKVIGSDTGRPEELPKHVSSPCRRITIPSATRSEFVASLIAQVDAPPATRIAWFTEEGSLRKFQREAAIRTRNTIAYAIGTARDFIEIYRSQKKAPRSHRKAFSHLDLGSGQDQS